MASPGLWGQSLRLEYESGLRVLGHYRSASRLDWEALSPPETGKTGTEQIHAAEVAPGVYFVSWLEAGGVTVSQVLDLPRGLVRSFVTYPTPQGRQCAFDAGRIVSQSLQGS